MRPGIAIFLVLCAALGLAVFTSGLNHVGPQTQYELEQAPPHTPAVEVDMTPDQTAAFDRQKSTAIHAKLEFEGKGALELELYPGIAPKTVAHFVALVNSRFYDGTKVHLVAPGHFIQMGDPATRDFDTSMFSAIGAGTHGSDDPIVEEPGLPNAAFTIGLSHPIDTDHGDSQFYINLRNNGDLDGRYTVFGRIIRGMENAQSLAVGTVLKRALITDVLR